MTSGDRRAPAPAPTPAAPAQGIGTTTTTTATAHSTHSHHHHDSSATNMQRATTGGDAPGRLRTWLHVAFWKKPLHLIASEEQHGHGHGVQSGGSGSGSGSESEGGSPSPTPPAREIERTLELFDLIMIGIGGTVGAGVFATAGLIASVYAGPGAVLSWLIAGVGCILSGLSFMELSCLIPSAGSTYAYTYHALGELPAMFAGFLLTLEYGVASAGGARSWSDKFTNWLATEWQVTGPEWMKPADSTVDLYAGCLMALCVAIVLAGMQAGKMLVNIVTMTKISVVVFIIVMGLLHFDAANVTPFVPEPATTPAGQTVFGWPGIFLGASASFFGYIGYDEVCCLAGEAKNPTYTIPRAVIGTIVGAAVLSTLATLSLVGMQRYTEIDMGESYGKAFEHVGLPWAATIVSTGEVLTMPITTFIGFLAQPRVQYAMAKDGLLPATFARVDANGNLFQGTLLCGVGAITIAIFVPFKVLWNFISLGILVAFNLTNTSLLLVRASRMHASAGGGSAHGYDRALAHTWLIAGFLVASFLAAFHGQKSVIAPVPITIENAVDASHMQVYMQSVGPTMTVLFAVVAFACMAGLKIVEAATATTLREALSPTSQKKQKKMQAKSAATEIALPSQLAQPSLRRRRSSADDGEDPTVELEYGARDRVISADSEDLMVTEDESTITDDASQDGAGRLRLLHGRTPHSTDSKRQMPRPAVRNSGDVDGAVGTSDDEDDAEVLTFQAPLVPFTPCLAIFFNWFLFAQMDAESVGLIALWLLLALAIYVGYSSHRSLAHQQLAYHRLQQ